MLTKNTLSLSLLALFAGGALGQSAFEISADGHAQARPEPGPGPVALDQAAGVYRGVGVPFGTTPDQSVLLRRQIGGLQIVDIDNDGHNDLVAVCYISNSFPPYDNAQDMIFFGNGSGINTAPGWLSDIDTHTGDVQVGDLDNNGYPDIVTIHGGIRRDIVRVYFGTPASMPTAPGYVSNIARASWGTSGVLADMDQDGDLDLVTTNQGVSPDAFRPMLMFDNTGTTLTTGAIWQSADDSIQNGIAAKDLTGDGFPDLAVAKWVNFDSGIYYNTTGVPDTNQSVFATDGDDADKGAAITDLDGDGTFEIGFGGDPSTVFTYDNNTLSLIYTANPPFGGPQDFRFFDVDGDGDDDLAEIVFGDGRAHIYLNRDGVLDTDPTWTFDAPEVGNALAFGDLNGDGRADLALGYAGDTCIRVFFAQAPACPADLNGDGNLDFFDISAFLNAFAGQDPIADFNGDGNFDFFDVSAFLSAFSAGCP